MRPQIFQTAWWLTMHFLDCFFKQVEPECSYWYKKFKRELYAKSWQLGRIGTIMYFDCSALYCQGRGRVLVWRGVIIPGAGVMCGGQTVQRWAPVNWFSTTLPPLAARAQPAPLATLPLLRLRVHQRQWRQWTLATIPGSAVLSSFVREAETASRINIIIDSTIYTTVKSLETFL